MISTQYTNLSIPMNPGLITNNGSFINCRGTGTFQTIQMASASAITYCSGSSQSYNLYQNGFGYVCSIDSAVGTSFTASTYSGTVTQNTLNCPPTANGYPGCSIVFASSNSIASCQLTLRITILV
jgi:hypothetical protein